MEMLLFKIMLIATLNEQKRTGWTQYAEWYFLLIEYQLEHFFRGTILNIENELLSFVCRNEVRMF